MSGESRKFIRIVPAPHKPLEVVLNLSKFRLEAFGTHGLVDGKVTTMQSGGDRFNKDNVVPLGDLPSRLARNIIPFLLNIPIRNDEKDAA